jgi:hypothetical protein
MVFSAGQVLTATILNSAAPVGDAQTVVNTTAGTTTSTTYTPTLSGSGLVTLAFVTPPSGAIWVSYTASVKHSATGGFATISVALSGAASTVAASDNYQAFGQTTDGANSRPEITVFRRFWFSGLTAGAAGLITMNHRIGVAGTGTFTNRQLAVEMSAI